MKEAIAYCREVKQLGYQVYVQAVSITSYSAREILDLIELVNELNPYALSIVDTYGLLHQENLMHYFELFNHNLNREIGIGYHSHNNFQLAYSNSIEVLRETADRRVLIDASLYGMGKSAGNLPLELISMYICIAVNAAKEWTRSPAPSFPLIQGKGPARLAKGLDISMPSTSRRC